ncbi:EAL domain-containing protein [Saccharibacillus brassicae]
MKQIRRNNLIPFRNPKTRAEQTSFPSEKQIFEEELEQAVEKRQFVMHYQAQIDLVTNRMRGMEALIRWNHPRHGLLSPIDFIELAESNGQIGSIGRWIIHECCRQAKHWKKYKKNFRMSINISILQLDHSLLDTLLQALRENELEASMLEIELTETAACSDIESKKPLLKAIRRMGITIALDDFGTGYSSLQYLDMLPVDYLKVDRSFVRKMHRRKELASMIIELGHYMNLEVIAEGIETQAQRDQLRSFGCDYGQGYFFCRPMSASEFEGIYFVGN